MRVRYTPEARANLEDIFTYLDERSPAAARSVKEGIVDLIQRLADYPLLGPETDEPGSASSVSSGIHTRCTIRSSRKKCGSSTFAMLPGARGRIALSS